jgi:hypothetical protein
MAMCNLGSDMGTTNTIMGTSHLGMASWLRDSGAILVVLGPLLLMPRGTAAIHCCEGDKTRLRTKEDIVEWHIKMEKHAWEGIHGVISADMSREFRRRLGLPAVGTSGRCQEF